MAHILAISNQKGGVGKTTTAVNLAASLAARGEQVLLVDCDPQGNAGSGLGHPRSEVTEGTYDVLMGYRSVSSVKQATTVEGLSVVPANRDLVGVEVELIEEVGRERRLREALDEAREDYRWILLDCPPSLGLLTINALVAADSVLIPLQAEYYAMEGLGELLRTVSAVRRAYHPGLVRQGIVVTMTDRRNNLCREVERQARAYFGAEVFDTVIPRNVRLGEAPSFGQPVLQYDRRSAGAEAYVALAGELIHRRGGGARLEVAS